MRKITPLLCVLWLLSSAGIAGLTIAMTHKSQSTTVQKATPAHNVNRAGKSDKISKIRLPAVPPQPRLPFPVMRGPIQI